MSVALEKYLPEEAKERLSKEPLASLVDWITKKAKFEVDGNPFDLNKVWYLGPLYHDTSITKVILKGSQIGASVYSSTVTYHGADVFKQRWIYYLPTDDEAKDFAQERMDGLIQSSDYLKSRIGAINSSRLKMIGRTPIYIKGLRTSRHAKSVPSDGTIFDEVDEHIPEFISSAEKRVLQSKWQIKIYLSVPSFENYGIDQQFQDSDQHVMVHTCPKCRYDNRLDAEFPHNFLEVPQRMKKALPGATHYRGCRKCGSRLNMREMVYVPLKPGAIVRGYRISRMAQEIHPPNFANAASYLMHEYDTHQKTREKKRTFNREFLAKADDGEGAQITDSLLQRQEVVPGFNEFAKGCFMLVDQGNNLHYSLFQRQPTHRLRLVFCGVTQEWEDLDKHWDRHQCIGGVVDGNPNRHPAVKWAAAHQGQIYIQDFAGDDLDMEKTAKLGRNEVPRYTVGRTRALDEAVDFATSGKNLELPIRGNLCADDHRAYDEWRLNVCNLKWKMEEKPDGRQVKVYLHNNNHHGIGLAMGRTAAFDLKFRRPGPGFVIGSAAFNN